jgi:hypothetical protein
MRWEYENTQTTFDEIGEKYGMRGQSVWFWAKKQAWVKYRAPVELTEELERKINQAADAAHDREMIRGLLETVQRNRPRSKKSATGQQSADTPKTKSRGCSSAKTRNRDPAGPGRRPRTY